MRKRSVGIWPRHPCNAIYAAFVPLLCHLSSGLVVRDWEHLNSIQKANLSEPVYSEQPIDCISSRWFSLPSILVQGSEWRFSQCAYVCVSVPHRSVITLRNLAASNWPLEQLHVELNGECSQLLYILAPHSETRATPAITWLGNSYACGARHNADTYSLYSLRN